MQTTGPQLKLLEEEAGLPSNLHLDAGVSRTTSLKEIEQGMEESLGDTCCTAVAIKHDKMENRQPLSDCMKRMFAYQWMCFAAKGLKVSPNSFCHKRERAIEGFFNELIQLCGEDLVDVEEDRRKERATQYRYHMNLTDLKGENTRLVQDELGAEAKGISWGVQISQYFRSTVRRMQLPQGGSKFLKKIHSFFTSVADKVSSFVGFFVNSKSD
mmetsp:Transcript_20263/g.51786  ORF Transcript_20263/g.51786 Transcript_20263/m.51786 type:complete len:213 (-) Transcript_20263:24-662(-)